MRPFFRGVFALVVPVLANFMFSKTAASAGLALDGNWTVRSVPWPSDGEFAHCTGNTDLSTTVRARTMCGADTLRDLAMERMLFYPPNSTKAFIPAAFIPSVPPATSFSMTNCTISTLCGTVSAYALMGAISPGGQTVSQDEG